MVGHDFFSCSNKCSLPTPDQRTLWGLAQASVFLESSSEDTGCRGRAAVSPRLRGSPVQAGTCAPLSFSCLPVLANVVLLSVGPCLLQISGFCSVYSPSQNLPYYQPAATLPSYKPGSQRPPALAPCALRDLYIGCLRVYTPCGRGRALISPQHWAQCFAYSLIYIY